ncbi:MAG: helix-turn-helix domain-containing protein [Bacteroidales bacterium]|nr:helix-turn-helix domain-containing protein [Bacteroidales bacterium]
MDQAFIRKLTEIVIANLTNEAFGVKQLAKKAGMSHASLHRRLKSIKNQNVSQFIREIRLQKAMELLHQNAGTVSEIAFMVGFRSPAYFIKCFHEYYGFSPGEVKKTDLIQTEFKNGIDDNGSSTSEQVQVIQISGPSGRMKLSYRIAALTGLFVIILFPLTWFLNNLLIKQHNVPGLTENDKSIVVLPFKNLTDNPDNQYIADGIMEDVLNDLYQVSDLRLISRTTSEHFRETGFTSWEIAREVNANYVLEGSVRRYGNKIRISVHLIDAYHDQYLWSANFDRDITDIIGVQSNIAMQIALKLKAEISESEIYQIEDIPTKNPEAYDYYLKGKFLFNKATNEQRVDNSKEWINGSIQYFEKAISVDKYFTEAYAGLANSWFTLSDWGWYQPYLEGIQKAREYSMKALEIDPDCAEAHFVKGSFLIWPERKWEEGRKELEISIQLNPNNTYAYQAFIQLLMITGPIEEARLFMDRAIELEPFNWVLHNLNAWIYYFEDRHKESLEACSIASELNDDYILNNWLFFLNYAKLDEGINAAEELQKIIRIETRSSQYDTEIMDIYNKSGIKGLFTWLIDININKPIPAVGLIGQPFFIAWWNAILGNKEKSIYWLGRNMESQSGNYTFFNLIATNPDFDILRSDPRFLAIIEEIGLTQYNTRKAK